MSTVADYIGRTVDVLAWDWSQASNSLVKLNPTLALPSEGGKIIGGIGKLAQRFLLELLTELGSIQYSPSRGCTFMTQLRLGALRTSLDIDQAFASSVVDIQRNLLLDQLASDPADECFGSASLTQINLSGDSVSIYITLISQSQTTVTVLLPLTTTITGGN